MKHRNKFETKKSLKQKLSHKEQEVKNLLTAIEYNGVKFERGFEMIEDGAYCGDYKKWFRSEKYNFLMIVNPNEDIIYYKKE